MQNIHEGLGVGNVIFFFFFAILELFIFTSGIYSPCYQNELEIYFLFNNSIDHD